ncbi:polysaccharide biosynthesis protein [Vibrio sp. SCSIO 43153]|jgi:FlaA1/EpsC-like NDP-sugar epimerase|uniref:polysaccharide biosynthesis protein n=1 Tax=Vibrio TaxID=662 RepID=UPI002074B548|nr:nucleoside-diphosphate sugar epimerase/dehydratase [Vibrio sp. SCSIO 43153]USD50227.1 polysaccharide biosynthesis protein [Vibrio sp. SCSIO 43153]
MINRLLNFSRPTKRLISVAADSTFIFVAYWAAFYTRMSEVRDFSPTKEHWYVLAGLILFTVVVFIRSGLYRAILRYMSANAVIVVSVSSTISALTLVLLAYYFQAFLPRSVPIIYLTYLIALSGGSRMVMRSYIGRTNVSGREKVIVYGAGAAGRQLVNLIKQGSEYKAVALMDDNRTLHKSIVQGLTVYPRNQLSCLQGKYGVRKVLLAIPSATRSERREIIEYLAEQQCEVLTIPNLDDLLNGSFAIDQLKEVSVDDLLGRDPVVPNQELLRANIAGLTVLVTGAGGSIGSELCRQIVQQSPSRLVLFERSEFALYNIEQELRPEAIKHGIELVPILGNVQTYSRLVEVFKSFNVNTVYHAAAYKHVPLVEYNVAEGILNNVHGTYQTALAAIQCGVDSFVLISTDKAVRPTNVMGTTKRLAELGLQALSQQAASKAEQCTRFCMVRFGNVLGSSGSVIPLFKKQIENGGPVTVTHPDITRYFMTIPEAAQLVIQAGSMGEGGDVFVLDMGHPVKISQLAENLIHLSGRDVRSRDNPEGDIEILYTGLRPGEKLYEELLIGDNVKPTAHSRIMSASEVSITVNEFDEILEKLVLSCERGDLKEVWDTLLMAPTGFAPSDSLSDVAWIARTRLVS